MQGMLKAAMAAAVLVAMAGEAAAAPYFVTTEQSGGNSQIDSAHASTWLFALGEGATLDLGGGAFTIKRGRRTAEAISLSVYLGADATGVLLESVSVAASAVTQSYAPVQFAFATPVELTGGAGGTEYFMALTSATPNAGNTQYFIKGESAATLAFEGPSSLAVRAGPGGSAVVPEPITAALLGAGLVGLGLVRRRARHVAE